MSLHPCTECGLIAEWHYRLKRQDKGIGIVIGVADGTQCWSPGQTSSNNPMHVLTSGLPVTSALS